jgi:hypothetical protein
MRFTLLFALLLSCFAGQAAVVQGTVVNASSTPIANQIVHVTDSSGGVQIFHLRDTTDAYGNYSITIPTGTSTGSLLHVYTEKCGLKYTSLQTWSGVNITVNFTVCGTTPCGDSVSGKVMLGSTTTAAYPAIVYLIKKSYNTTLGAYVLTKLDSTYTSANGEYHFYCITVGAGDLLIKAALTSANSNYSSYLPTYKENSLTWNTARAASFTPGANNIHMVAGTNPGGPGFIGGSVLMGANKSTNVGDPLSQRLLLLTTINDDGVAWTYSNASGQFSFNNLPYGTYKLFGDAWGKDNPVTIVTIDANHPTFNNIVFEENSGSFAALGVNNPIAFSSVKCFPNPMQNELNISGLGGTHGNATIQLFNMNGALIQTVHSTKEKITIPTAQLPGGFYILKIETAEGTAVYRLTK